MNFYDKIFKSINFEGDIHETIFYLFLSLLAPPIELLFLLFQSLGVFPLKRVRKQIFLVDVPVLIRFQFVKYVIELLLVLNWGRKNAFSFTFTLIQEIMR